MVSPTRLYVEHFNHFSKMVYVSLVTFWDIISLRGRQELIYCFKRGG